jgi:hypothetical protein
VHDRAVGKWQERIDSARAVTWAVVDTDPEQIERAAVSLGGSRRYLAPLAWAAGTLVLVARGLKLLALNWRLALVELVPAAWVWVMMWDIGRDELRAAPLREVTPGQVALALAVMVPLSSVAFWCNTVFAVAVGHEPPTIREGVRRARPLVGRVTVAGAVMGVLLTTALAVVPRIESDWVHLATLIGVYSLMLVALVAVPVRIAGMARHERTPSATVARWVTGCALSMVAMAPGLVVDRVGVLFLEVPGLGWLGFALLTVGIVLYAAGLAAVKAVKLTMRLDLPEAA